MARGGERPNSGRKPKSEEAKLITKLAPYEDEAIEALIEGMRKKDKICLRMFFEYMYGKPKQQIDSNTNITTKSIDFKDLISGFNQDS
jgi:hypothetical protein